MAPLVAGFGPVGRGDRDRILADLGEPSFVDVWTSPERAGCGWLGVVGAGGSVRNVTDPCGDLAAAGVGAIEGGADVAGAALLAYREAGAAGLARLRGEYAFAIWDGRSRSLVVGCDAIGFRAPAYLWDGEVFLLSSSALALLRCPHTRPQWDGIYLGHALAGIRCHQAEATPFAGVRRMKGGDLLRVSVTGIERLTGDRLYFDVVGPRDRPAAAVELRARVEQAIGGAAGDPETCVSLSGGLDSTVVAALVARRRRSVDALSLVAPAFSQRDDGAAIAAAAAIPGVRHHRIEVTDDIFGPLAFLPDDPVCAAPVLEAGRRALLGAARAAGFRRVIDGEGGDELFDLAWWSRDLIFEGAVRQVVARLTRRSSLSRLVSEFAVSAGLAPVSGFRVEPLERRLRRQRPWLREALWEGPGFAAATAQSRSYWSLRSARRRLPLVLASHGRYWRAQETVRSSLGVEGMSPLLHREVIEFVGSLPADTVMAPHHGKALLRCLATQLVPPAIAWRRKREPLSEWLAERFIASDDRVAAGVGFIIESRVLREVVDPSAVLAAVGQARRERQAAQIQSLVELFTLAEWIATVQSRYGV